MRQGLKKALSIALAAMMVLPGAGTARAAESGTGADPGSGILNATPNEASGDLIPVGDTAFSGIKDPLVSDGVTTWDCIWFGNYWQEDTNGDGHCFEKDTTVTKHEPDNDHHSEYYTDQDGKELYGFVGEEKTYYADEKEPVKWRVLDIDDNGNALLLADKLIDIVRYNESNADVTWQTCTLRSYLNGYDDSENRDDFDFTGDNSFLNNAFSEPERNTIISSELTNPDNPVYGTTGGHDTHDKIFCLSLAEAMNLDYGFVKNEFNGDWTDDDPARVAVTTKFTEDKPDYYGETAGRSDLWWLRSPGMDSNSASYVSDYGAASAYNRDIHGVDDYSTCVRPAFRMNLSSSSSLWRYAGTVSSDGSDNEIGFVTGVTVTPKERTIRVDGAVALSAEVKEYSKAPDKSFSWTSSDEEIATVDSSGIVTGVKAGTATITVTATDGGYTDTCKVIVAGPDMIADPSVTDGVTTWDCIWFGNYWQGDTNGDGHCFDKDTTVTKHEADDSHSKEYYTDQDGKELFGFEGFEGFDGETKTYPADAKQPIKWRVLEIDEFGNALLLADKLIDIVQYNETFENVTWSDSTIRSYLNGYTASQNMCNKDFSENSGNRSFVYSAFDEEEIKSISSNEVVNSENPVYGTPDGENTNDRIFCLSLAEAMNEHYGFIKNEFTRPYGEVKKYYTDIDPARVAVTTKFTEDKPGYSGDTAGTSARWWLRSPGYCSTYASYVSYSGAADAGGNSVYNNNYCARPAFRMNLSSSSSLWRYAGTVSSDGADNEIGFVTGVTVSPKEKTIRVDGEVALSAKVKEFSNAPDKSVTWTSSDEEVATVDSSGIVTGVKAGTATITATTTEGGYTDTCKVTVAGSDMVADPSVAGGVSTWDCIWFGNYWQGDTNGDGHCFEKDTTVTKHEPDPDHDSEYYTDQDGKELDGFDGFDGETKTYPADDKQPIKWRVLDIDGSGNALLLADKLIDIVPYNETDTNVTWETCTMRSYLNGYDDSKNVCKKDFSENSGNRSFVYSAFDENEIKTISSNEVVNPDNPVYGTPGGENTNDRIFCLSLAEAMNPDYGFMENEFTGPVWADKKYNTDDDPARVAVTTKFTEDKPGYYGKTAGRSAWWWLRSPGYCSAYASDVSDSGEANAHDIYVDYNFNCVRPAFRMNLSSSSSLWRYAGTVCSDGSDNEIGFVTGVTVSPKEKTIKAGVNATLSAEVKEYLNAPDKTVTWTSSDEKIVTVDSTSGSVTGVKAGTATITATTTEGGYTDTCKVTVVGPDMIADPSVADGVSTWDCIWFGNYWQGDTNGDGHCFDKDTTVTKHEPDPDHDSEYYTDQDGKELVGFEGFDGETKTYPADAKQPIKWRVLDIDGSGNALLLADKLIDIVRYNETDEDVTWSDSTIRSYLNGYDGSKNVCKKDFSENSGNMSFIYSAFDENEIKSISSNEVVNPDNPVYGTPGGENTNDRIFCLSLAEAMNPDYGFIENEFTWPYWEVEKYYTDDDPARVAVTTKFTEDKPGYYGETAGRSDWWWLRSPGTYSSNASGVSNDGAATADFGSVHGYGTYARPAFRMNLSSSSSLWRYAGTVSSNDKAVTEVYLPETSKVVVGKTITLTPVISPADATDQAVTWKSSAEGVATVSEKGVVTGVTEGNADITVTTHDGGFTATCRVTVSKEGPGPGPDPGPDTVSVNKVTLPATGSVKVGKTLTLTPEISPADATDQAVTWKSSAESVATVSTEGVVTGITEGTADITVTTNDGGFTATCRVTVSKEGPGPGPAPGPDPSEEDLEKDIDPDPEELDLHMLPGEVRRLKINRTGKYVYGVSYVSSDTKTVSVKNGVVTAKNLKKGETEKTVKVTATYNGESADFTITVRAGTPGITPGEKGSKISAAKTVKADVGSSKTVTAAVKLPKALQGKEVRAKVVLPEDLPGTSVADGDTENDFFDLGEGKPDVKGTKVSFVITPREAGAAYIVWTVTDDSGKESQAHTKVLVKKPLSALSANCPEDVIDLGVGEGKRLTVTTTKGNTDTKDLSFSVKMKKGKGVKVSKSGFVTAASPDAEAEVTVKSGKVKKTVTVKVDPYSGSVLALNKTSVSAKIPKTGGKPKTVAFKITTPKKNPPAVIWSITSPPEEKDPEGIIVKDGKVTVIADASPGCYTVTATPEGSSGYNPACCEVIVK